MGIELFSSHQDLFQRATAPEGDATGLPRTLLVLAHPDDETVALGARLGRFSRAHFVYVTDGAPRNEQDSRWHGFASWREYRAARFEELRKVFSTAGIPSVSWECLEIPDQGASLHLGSIATHIAKLMSEREPEVTFTHPFEGGHPDHDACAFAVHRAVQRHKGVGTPCPLIIEGAFYNAAASGPGWFLPGADHVLYSDCRLTVEERTRKQNLIACFRSQQETLRGFPLDSERFRVAPTYDFGRPPHPPPLLYERFPWGMTSERFNRLARHAEDSLHEGR